MLNYYLFERLGMLPNRPTTIILNGHFHDVLGLPVPPWNFLEIVVVVFFLG